jgi:hypothetical protein
MHIQCTFLKILTILSILITIVTTSCNSRKYNEKELGYPITPVSFTDVELTDDFWAERIETNRVVTKENHSGMITNCPILHLIKNWYPYPAIS